jgi:chaperonin GroES
LQRLYYSLGIQDDDILVKFKAGSEPDLDTADVIGDDILVKVIKAKENISTGGILVAKTTKRAATSSFGEVVKVGPGRFAFNGSIMRMDAAVRNMVQFRDFSAEDVEINKETYAVLKMTDWLNSK